MTQRSATAIAPTLALALLAGCAAGGPASAPVPTGSASAYACPDGRTLTVRFDPATDQTDLWIGATEHRLGPVPDPNGGLLYQDGSFQLRHGGSDDIAILTDRETTVRQECRKTIAVTPR